MTQENFKNKLDDILFRAIEGSIMPEELDWLQLHLKERKDVREYYLDFIEVHAGLNHVAGTLESRESIASERDEPFIDYNLLTELLNDSQRSPSIELESDKNLIEQTIQIDSEAIKPNKFTRLYNALISVAAVFMLVFIVYANLFPPKISTPVATLQDQIGVKWGSLSDKLETGDLILTNQPAYIIEEGIVKIKYDQGVDVLIEGPAEFQILADDRIGLTYGKVYSKVQREAIGFSVYTPSTKIIDLGTEFGVHAQNNGDTKLYVVKGKTALVAGDGDDRASVEVTRNSAKYISGDTHKISDIPYNSQFFVRDLNGGKYAWRGENIELASLIAGGNGFEPVLADDTLNPITGKYELKPLVPDEEKTNYKYNIVAENEFIDGVFVPDGSEGPVQVTSESHQFSCPVTSGNINRNICIFYKPYDKNTSDIQPALFNGIVYDSKDYHSILLHSNIGITIDLDRIRKANPSGEIHGLKTGYGLTWAERRGKVDFYILADGNMIYEDRGVISQAESNNIDLKFESEFRFLSIVVTDAFEEGTSKAKAHENDFFYLLNPELILE